MKVKVELPYMSNPSLLYNLLKLYYNIYVINGLQNRCDAALGTLQKVQSSLPVVRRSRMFAARKKRLGSDFSHAFLKSKKSVFPTLSHTKKSISYTHRFFCLSKSKQESVPMTDSEKDALLEAGYGEKKITIADMDINGEEFRELILKEYLKLKEAGGLLQLGSEFQCSMWVKRMRFLF